MAPAVVLVVDDNAENRALARETLDDEGIRVLVARDAAEGIREFVTAAPDCILLDIRMPGTDGITACEQIRALPGGDRVAILFVTAQRDVDTFDRALRAGGDDFLTKPFRPAELVVRIRTALRLRQMTAERGELAEELKKQRDEMLRLQLQKEQLSAFLVHDLKSPVHAVELYAQRILRDTGADARSREAALRIRDETRALMRMITNLLDIGRADEGQLALVRVAVEPAVLAGEVVDELGGRADTCGVTLVTDVDAPAFSADRDLVRRVLANLVDNAIRHAPEGSSVRIRITRGDRSTELRVSDAGSGVPLELRDRVFDRFVSGHHATRTNRGLGLAFCKSAVEAHGGRIWIEDANPGAAFCVRIPDVD